MSSIAQLKFQKGCYLAFVLTDESRSLLLSICPPTYSKVICHHVTIAFEVSAEKLKKFQAAYVSVDPMIEVTGVRIGENVDCFTVNVDGSSRRTFGDGQHYHVTLSVEPPAKPVDANKLFRSSIGEVKFETPIKLSGTFQLLK